MSGGTNAVYLNGTFDDTIAAYINRAKYTVDIAQYDYTSIASSSVAVIATAANNAYLRGVVVRWIYNGSSSNTGLSLLNAGIQTLGSPTTSSYGIMHNKFMVIDVNSANSADAIVMTGSYDFSTEQTNSDFNNILFIQDQNLAVAYYNEFNKMWGGTGASPVPASEAFGTHKTTSAQHIFNVNGTTVELYFSPKDTVGKHLQSTVNSANTDLFFGIYTFTDTTVADLIKIKYNSGVSVKGIMDQYSLSYAPYTILNPVLGNNMQVYSGSYIYHNKIMVIDASNPLSDPQVFTGSFNWSNAAETSNDENAIIIHDETIANEYLQSLCQNFADVGGTACTPVVLPLKLLYFKGSLQQNNEALLSWASANEIDNKSYEVERSSDNINFNSIATINSTGNGTNTQTYQYTDAKPYPGISYYRLMETDNTNQVTYSDVIALKGRQDIITIYPNPVTDVLSVNTTAANTFIRINNYLGQSIQTVHAINTGVIKIPMSTLPKGIYNVEVLSTEGKTVKSFIKN
jgi:phosphatidylserine/phosphatidylglycerophosphate/cardiolipin synthase-like enzyme